MSKKIVVADDEAHILAVVSMKLTNAGFQVFTARDGQEALELCTAETPDLLITDYQMPCMTGMELCKKLRQSGPTGQIPAIMLTARGFDLEPAEMSEAGIVLVMTKPFSPREVAQKANEVLQAKESVSSPG